MNALREVAVALAVTLASCPVVLWSLRRLGVLDAPNERSLHSQVTPRGGGIAVALGCVAGIALSPLTLQAAALVTGGLAFALLGFVDDIRHLPVRARLPVQLILATGVAALVLHGVGASSLATLTLAGLAILWIVSYVNAYNFMDGINGISAAQAVLAGLYWGVIGLTHGAPLFAAGGLVLAGASAGFAPFNVPRARMFLGDTGSYFIGAWMAVVVLLGVRARLRVDALVAPVALYAGDTGSTLLRRLARGEPWQQAHRDHVYQKLVASGWSHVKTAGGVAIFIAACSALGGIAGDVASLPLRVGLDVGVIGAVGAYLALPCLVVKAKSRPSR